MKRNVLICIPCLLTGGTEIQTYSLIEALIAANYHPIVACYFEYSPSMVERYRATGATVELMNKDGKRTIGVWTTLKHLWNGFRRIIKKHSPQIAHVQYMAPGAMPIVVLRALGMKHIISTAHTSADIYPSLKQIHWLSQYILTAFQCITLKAETSFFGNCNLFSESMHLRGHGNHFTIYNNLPSYITPATNPRKGSPQTIGVVSRLEKIKGMDLVIPAFAHIYRSHPEMRLLVVGDGSLRELMEQQIGEYKIPDSAVIFTGQQSQEFLQDYYDKIDILLMPSRSEGFGLTAIEGMARGCVPVVADTGGLPEVIEDGISGRLHKSGNWESIVPVLEELIISSEQFRLYSSEALNRAMIFSSERYKMLISSLYNKILL